MAGHMLMTMEAMFIIKLEEQPKKQNKEWMEVVMTWNEDIWAPEKEPFKEAFI